jgi:peptidoglycan biosynthesis protein MviN/MurJ (putative lipid II flippase)
VAGLALASALGATVNAAGLLAALRRRFGFSMGPAFRKIVPAVLAAAGVMGLVVSGFWYHSPSFGAPLVKMGVTAFLGAGVYVGLLRALRVHEIEDVVRWAFKKK